MTLNPCNADDRGFLYAFLGLASFVVWTQGGFAEQSGPLLLYAVNLVLNLAWMPVRGSYSCLSLSSFNVCTLKDGFYIAHSMWTCVQ